MATRPTTQTEDRELGTGIMITCDDCGRAIDKLGESGFWRGLYDVGGMYAGRTLCPSCHEADVHEREEV